ncbi:MAG: hypothetical protein IPK31_17070 [Chitinophagaceae bacterium]|nr:hypothetical protein [Chitinophagaceae bacterium]
MLFQFVRQVYARPFDNTIIVAELKDLSARGLASDPWGDGRNTSSCQLAIHSIGTGIAACGSCNASCAFDHVDYGECTMT